MAAYLELIELGPGATCSLEVGERVRLPDDTAFGAAAGLDADFVLGRAEGCDVVMTSRGQGGRRNCGIRAVGNGHQLQHYRHQGGIEVAGRMMRDGHVELRHGDVIRPGAHLAFRYVSDRARTLSSAASAFGPLLCFEHGDRNRCRSVPRANPGAAPRLTLISALSHARTRARAERYFSVDAPAALRLHDVVPHGAYAAVLVTDAAGPSFTSIIRATVQQDATLDAAVVIAIVSAAARALPGSAAEWLTSDDIVVTWAGDVRFTGTVDLFERNFDGSGDDTSASVKTDIARMLLGVLTPDDGGDDDHHQPQTPEETQAEEARQLARWLARAHTLGGALGPVLARALHNACAFDKLLAALAQPPSSSAAELAALVRNLFPDAWAAEQLLREELATLSCDAVDALVGA